MSDGFLGEIRLFPYSRVPRGWRRADGAILPFAQYQALGSLLGDMYGGDGSKTFALPDLRGRVPLGYGKDEFGNAYGMGAVGGQEAVGLTVSQLPAHTHDLHACTQVGTTGNAAEAHIAAINTDDLSPPRQRFLFGAYPAAANLTHLNEGSLETYGLAAPAPHDNMQPFSVIDFYICMSGAYPPRG